MRLVIAIVVSMVPMTGLCQGVEKVEDVLSGINQWFYEGSPKVCHIDYLYHTDCSARNEADRTSGVMVRDGDRYYTYNLDEEVLFDEGRILVIYHDLKEVWLLEGGGDVVLPHNAYLSESSKLIESVSTFTTKTVADGKEQLEIGFFKGDINSLSITYHPETYQLYSLLLSFIKYNSFGFDPLACIEIKYRTDNGSAVGNYKEKMKFSRIIQPVANGQWKLTPPFSEYELLMN